MSVSVRPPSRSYTEATDHGEDDGWLGCVGDRPNQNGPPESSSAQFFLPTNNGGSISPIAGLTAWP